MAKNILRIKKPIKHPRNQLDEPCWSKYRRCSYVCAFVIFKIIVITVGVMTVYFTSPKNKDQTCRLTFKRSAEQANEYDSRPRQVALGDFNQDGHLDIIVANAEADNIGLFFGYGNGTFASKTVHPTELGSRPCSVAVGDFNNDTLLDIVVANYGTNSIGVFLGYGNGTFANQIITSLGSAHPFSLAIGDFNDDKLLDITVANYYGSLNVAILLGSNDGSFRIDKIYDMGYDSIPYSIAVADLNKDNKFDIVTVNYGTSEIAILLAQENGSFVIQKYSTGNGSHPRSVTIADFNNDHILDIAVANFYTSNVGSFLGNGNGTFKNLVTHSTGVNSYPQYIVAGNFNNDIQVDIAIVDWDSGNLLLLKGNGNGSFSIITKHSTGGYNSLPCSIAVGDFDNDNKTDIAIANSGTNSIFVLTSFAIYPVTRQANYSTGPYSDPFSVAVADFNEDKYLDIAVANNFVDNVGVFLNLENGTFQDQETYNMSESSSPYFLSTSDLNNDNHIDIVVVLQDIDKLGILLGYGNGTFQHGNMYSTGDDSKTYSVAMSDFNNDGNVDIITANYGTDNVGLFYGFGDGTFTKMITLLAGIGYYPNFVGVGDFNNDNISDIAASNSASGGIAILLGYGNGSFQNPIYTSTNDDLPNTFTIGDLNNDNRSDIVYTDTSFSHVGVILGSGNGMFESLTQYSTAHGSQPWSVALGYYNNDTLLDIAVANVYGCSINIFLGTGNGSFVAAYTLSTGPFSYPWSVMFGDFNNDHQQDLVVANEKTYNIVIFFVYYAADFANEASYLTGSGSHPYSVSVGDLNNDGQPDIVVANSANDNIEILIGYNEGTFMNRTIFSTGYGSHPHSVTIADFNKDDLLDIAVVNFWDDSMNVFLGYGNGSFDTKTVYSTGSASYPNSIAAGDFNKDNRTDIVIADKRADNVVVFLAFDYVVFTNSIVQVRGRAPGPYYVATGDFNNDDRLDIAVANYNANNLGIYLGYGNGTFSEQMSYSTGPSSSPQSLAVGDLNNDNYIDIVVANYGTNSIGIFFGYGNGSFQSQVPYSTGNSSEPISVSTGDFNNDNRLDIVTANFRSDNVCVFLGHENGSFTGQIVYSMTNKSDPQWVVVGDLNNDKILDLVVANRFADNVCILLGYGDGSFGNVIILSTGYNSGPSSVAIGDLNNDNLLDIAVANQQSNSTGIFFGYGNDTFSSQKIYLTNSGSFLYSIIVNDVNNDTLLDILVVDFNRDNSSIGIFYGFGNGEFTLPTIYPTGLNSLPRTIAIGDFNNDRRVDLAVNYYNQDSIGIMLQLKNAPFASSALFSTGNQSQPKSVAVGDFNNDDHLDIAVANSATNNIGILLGYGDGYFNHQLTSSTGDDSLPSSIAVGHFNNDSYLDIAVANNRSTSIGILLGYGNGTFANVISYPIGVGSDPLAIAVGDLNKDKHLDLVVSNWGTNNVIVFFGLGNGNFLDPMSYSVGYDARPQSVTIGDINNDSLLDIVVANYGSNYVEILLQTC